MYSPRALLGTNAEYRRLPICLSSQSARLRYTPEEDMPTTIALVDDHRLFREGLKSLLEAQPDIRVVGEAADGLSATAMVRQSNPDVVVLDVLLPGKTGIEVARELLRDDPTRKLIALSMVRDEQHVSQALDVGILGYASKEQSVQEVVNAIR